MRILVIDDSDLARAGMRTLLEEAGMSVFDRDSGIGSTRSILQHDMDAIVLDLNMPGIAGDKLVGLLRDNPRLQDLVIVVVSALPWSELQERSRHIGADWLLTKDRAHDALVSLLKELVAKRTRPARRRSAPLFATLLEWARHPSLAPLERT